MRIFSKIKFKFTELTDIVFLKTGLFEEIESVFILLRKHIEESSRSQIKCVNPNKGAKLLKKLNLNPTVEISEVKERVTAFSESLKTFYSMSSERILDTLNGNTIYDNNFNHRTIISSITKNQSSLDKDIRVKENKSEPLHDFMFLTPTKEELLDLMDAVLRDLYDIRILFYKNNRLYRGMTEDERRAYNDWYHLQTPPFRNKESDINEFYLNIYRYVKLFITT